MAGVLLLLLLTLSGIVGEPGRAGAETMSEELRRSLQAGGLVIFLRHGLADEGVDENPRTLGLCSQQRRLSPQGRAAAHDIARAVAHLSVPIGLVLSSPYCRAMETAAIAFGPMIVDHRLRLWQGELSEQEKTELPLAVKRMLATPPKLGSNTVLVSHNSKDALGFDLDQGEAAVVRPLGEKGFTVLAKLRPGDWDSAAPAVTDEARPPWIVAEYPVNGPPIAVRLEGDGAPLVSLAEGAVVRLDPFTGMLSSVEQPRGADTHRRAVVVPATRNLLFGGASWRIAADGGILVAESGAALTPLRLPPDVAPVHEILPAADRLWLSRPRAGALLMIRRP